MGSVSVTAGNYLCQHLGAQLLKEVPSDHFFDVDKIEIDHGLATPGSCPKNSLFGWQDPQGVRDLLIFVAEAQPAARGLELCRALLDEVEPYGAERVFTFAAMGTQQRPTENPRVFAVANQLDLVAELRTWPVELLEKGQITGLNGVLLTAAAERSLPAVSLLGEMPFFAGGVPNPRASLRVLEVFSEQAGITMDLEQLDQHARSVQEGLLRLLEQMTQNAQQAFPPATPANEGAEEEELGFSVPDFAGAAGGGAPEAGVDLPAGDRDRIERLFRQASRDRSQALQLKAELDRLGVFESYENRFLDLFKSGE